MFDKAEYWNRRRQVKRGQGDKIKPTPVAFSDEDGGFPKQGQHLIRVRGRGLQRVNRKQARSNGKLHFATAKNYDYQQSKKGFKHDVNTPGTGFERRVARLAK